METPEIETDDPFEGIDGPYVATFTGRLPFLLGIPNHLGHTIRVPHLFVDPSAASVFGSHPIVRIRVFTAEIPGIPMRTPGADRALKRFYNYDLSPEQEDRFAAEEIADCEQWVTLETPGAIAVGEDASDKGYAFHRCLRLVNLFIHAVMVATNDFRLRTVVAQDFKPAIVIGAIPLVDRHWRLITDMMMFPDFPFKRELQDKSPFSEEQFQDGLRQVQNNAPFVRALLWRGQVEDAMQRTGDAAAAIAGLQTAAESLLFDTYRMLLVDEGLTGRQIIGDLASEPAFATLIKTLLKGRLGGPWDYTTPSTPVGAYWTKLYQVRNDMVHRGIQPHYGQAEEARDAYHGLFEFVAERLRRKCRTYPRTLLALVGEDSLRQRGWLSNWMSTFVDDLKRENGLFFQPWDDAGRSQ